MSTQETDEFPIAMCPCGKGVVIRSITTQDNPWSSADIHHHIECGSCGGEWKILGTAGGFVSLVKPASETAYNSRLKEYLERRYAITAHLRALLGRRLEELEFKSKKAEWNYLVKEGAYRGNYQSYLKVRQREPMIEVAYPAPDTPLAQSLLEEFGREDYTALQAAEAFAKEDADVASRKIERARVPINGPLR